MNQMNLSARAYHRILKLARTIADLAGSEAIQQAHLAEALHASQSSEVDSGVNDLLRKSSALENVASARAYCALAGALLQEV
jgi:septal ring factor EnvC (AmiA/AmiB activator)